MSEYAFYSFAGETMPAWGKEAPPVPVRLEMESEVFGGEEVRIDLLVDELVLFLNQYPDLRDLYAGTMQVLTWLTGASKAMEGDVEAGSIYLEMGLDAAPDSLLLRSNYALALQLLGRGEEALEQYEVVLADPEGRENPMVRLLAARLYAELGDYLQAYRLLDEMARGLPEDDAFWDFLAEMKELAGLEGEEEGEEEETEAVTAQAPTQAAASTCPACGQALKPGARFCRACGTKVEVEMPLRPEEPRPTFCPDCGGRIREGARFCRRCGKPL